MKISIVTATWNSADTIRDTLESVLSQSYHDFEHVIVDGNSSDSTMDIVKEYEPRYDGRLRYISEPDKGLYDAMNKGIRMATGDVVGILNSDDFYTNCNVLEHIADAFANESCDAVYGDIHFTDSETLTKCTRYYSSKSFRPWMMRLGHMPAHPSFYCKRCIFERYGLFNTSFRISADFEQLFRFIYVNRIHTLYLSLDFVTMRTGGVSTSGFKSQLTILKETKRACRINGYGFSYLGGFMKLSVKAILMAMKRLSR